MIELPKSNKTVRVRMVDTTAVMVVNAKAFVQPGQQGHEYINIYVAAFLVENPSSGRKIMFDLGVRKDYWNLPAVLQKRLGTVIPGLRVDRDVTEVLQEKGVALDEISTIIWSHYHWDHIGNTALFNKSTELVVGPGFKASPHLLPGFPNLIDSPVDSAVFEGRQLTEIDFLSSALSIGGYAAHDFFGDGSFYLLDTPGHCLGHMCALARTTAGFESTFVLLGGDICHFVGNFRPSPQIPLPDPIPSGVLDKDPYFPAPCPCSIFTDHHPLKQNGDLFTDARCTPFYRISTDLTAAYADPARSQKSVDKLVDFDSHPSVMVCLAHDETTLRLLPTLNESPQDDLNTWKEKGYKEMTHWGWLNDLSRSGRPAKARAVDGFWRDEKPWPGAIAELLKKGEKASKITL